MDENVVAISISRDRWNAPERRCNPPTAFIFAGGEKVGLKIKAYERELSALCAAYGVRRLAVFGSASRGEFDPRQSDVDFLVAFEDAGPRGAFDRYFGFKEALAQLFECPVDLVEEKAIKNPYFKQAILRDRMLVYGTGSQETDL